MGVFSAGFVDPSATDVTVLQIVGILRASFFSCRYLYHSIMEE